MVTRSQVRCPGREHDSFSVVLLCSFIQKYAGGATHVNQRRGLGGGIGRHNSVQTFALLGAVVLSSDEHLLHSLDTSR